MQTKFNTAIADANGNRKVTSTTEQLRIPASEIRPGDWLLKPHRRGLRKDKFVESVVNNGRQVMVNVQLHAPVFLMLDGMVDVERTT